MYDRDRVLAGVDLTALAVELLGPRKGNQRSGTWPCPSPQHAQTGRTPPVSVFTTRRGEQRWRCHGCGAGGTAIDLVMACHHTDVRGALDQLARRSGVRDMADGRPPLRPQAVAEPAVRRPEAVAAVHAYVRSCADRLWQPAGRPIREWLTRQRGLPEAVLRANLVGADPGRKGQARPYGVPKTAGAVFPALEDGTTVYVQLRRLGTGQQPRWLNVAAQLLPNPKIALYDPPEPAAQAPVIVTEGPIDALTACAAGFRSAAILGATAGDDAVARRLAALRSPLVVAFDADEAGRAGASALIARLETHGRRPASLEPPTGVNDLNDWHRHDPLWARHFQDIVRQRLQHSTTRAPPALS